MITLPKDKIELCSLVDENGDPDTDIQFLITMEAPGTWTVQVIDQNRVRTAFQANLDDAPVRGRLWRPEPALSSRSTNCSSVLLQTSSHEFLTSSREPTQNGDRDSVVLDQSTRVSS